jgi:hypothetical protein
VTAPGISPASKGQRLSVKRPAKAIDEKQLLAFLYRIGAFWNPLFPNGRNVDQSNVAKLTLKHALAKHAVASWQGLDANFNSFARMIHRRDVVPDGDVGPVTAAMLTVPRCAMPDFAPPPDARFQYDDPGVQNAVESYQRYAEAGYTGGSGSWPKGCDPQRPDVHSVVVAIDTSAASSSQKQIIDQVLKYVEQTEAEIGQSVRHVRDGSFANPHHNVRYESIAGSVIGYAYFPTPDTCRQTVQARIDNTFNASLPVMAELLTHEYKGHSDGLEHTSGGIMNPSIGNPTSRATWIGDPSFGWKRRYFGGSPLPTGPVDPPPPPPPPNPDPPPSPPPPPPPPPPVPVPQIEVAGTVRVPIMGSPSGTLTVRCGNLSDTFGLTSAGARNYKPVRKSGADEPDKKPGRRKRKA